MWHVSSRSGVATLRTAIHLLLSYLLTYFAVTDLAGWYTLPQTVAHPSTNRARRRVTSLRYAQRRYAPLRHAANRDMSCNMRCPEKTVKICSA